MKSIAAFTRAVKNVRRDWLAGRYDRALAQVSGLLKKWPDNPRLWIMWADLIQLQDAEEGPSLADAKAAYQRAIDLDDHCVEAFTEMGLYIYAIEDDAQAAIPYFMKAAAMCRAYLEQALAGLADAYAELERTSEAKALLKEVRQLQSHRSKSANGTVAGSKNDHPGARFRLKRTKKS